MTRIVIRVMTEKGETKLPVNIGNVVANLSDNQWVWVDFSLSEEEDIQLLSDVFHFHPLAIEDCLQFLQRPKLDYYDGYNFYVLHALNQETSEVEEVDIFVSERFLVSFRHDPVVEIDEVWNSVILSKKIDSPAQLFYHILDKIVDMYFPAAYNLEDALSDLEDKLEERIKGSLIDQIFDTRKDLIKLRRSFQSTRELVYRMLNSERLKEVAEHKVYFNDIYDHLLRLAEIVESSLELTADMRDSYFSLNSNRMNAIMMTLTVISAIFIPLTFIVGVYGMNFDNMPELHWHYGYYGVMVMMLVIGVCMVIWFAKKGWFKS